MSQWSSSKSEMFSGQPDYGHKPHSINLEGMDLMQKRYYIELASRNAAPAAAQGKVDTSYMQVNV